jgi:hypothetical protein
MFVVIFDALGVAHSSTSVCNPYGSAVAPRVDLPLPLSGVCHNVIAPVSESVALGWLPHDSESSLRGEGQFRTAVENSLPSGPLDELRP